MSFEAGKKSIKLFSEIKNQKPAPFCHTEM